MDMTVDDAGHDEFAAEVRDLSFKCREPCLIAHIDELPVLHRKCGRHGLILVRCKNLCVPDNLVSFHFMLLSLTYYESDFVLF